MKEDVEKKITQERKRNTALITFTLPKETHRELKVKAAETGTTMTAIINQAISKFFLSK